MRRLVALISLIALLAIPAPAAGADPLHLSFAYDNCSATFTENSSEGQVWVGAIDGDYTIEQTFKACDHWDLLGYQQDLFRVLLFYRVGDHPTLSVTGPDGNPVLVTGPYKGKGVQRSLKACTTHALIGTYTIHVGGSADDSNVSIASGGLLTGSGIETTCP